MLKRYRINSGYTGEENPEGEWVRYEDLCNSVQNLRDTLDELKSTNSDASSVSRRIYVRLLNTVLSGLVESSD